jgi:alkylation response protein AidB-like acyl-CoA dehydrogenase
MTIDLNFSSDQEQIHRSAQQFFRAEVPPELVRRYRSGREGEEEFARDLWKQMAELGWLAMPFAEAHGGFDAGVVDMYPIFLELGRSLAPVPLLETVILAGGLIAGLGSGAQKDRHLGAIARGEAIYAAALGEDIASHGIAPTSITARGNSLSGTVPLVSYAGSADFLLVLADDQSLFLVDRTAPGLTLEAQPNIAGMPLYAVTLADVPGEQLGGNAQAVVEAVVAKATVLQAAMVTGAGSRILELSTDYAKTRTQFGQQIGKHQAVQYRVTDVAIDAHNTGLLALHAAWAIDAGRPFLRAAAMAKAASSRAAARMPEAGHEVHAGIAFMIDYDLQLYTRHCKHWEFSLGDRRTSLEQVAALPA